MYYLSYKRNMSTRDGLRGPVWARKLNINGKAVIRARITSTLACRFMKLDITSDYVILVDSMDVIIPIGRVSWAIPYITMILVKCVTMPPRVGRSGGIMIESCCYHRRHRPMIIPK